MLLTIDAGNTRTKWATFDHDGSIRQYGACGNQMLEAVDLSPQSLGYERIVISNVAGRGHASLLARKLSPYQLPVNWIKSSDSTCNIISHYTQPSTLGTDRWAALIAAWHVKNAACIVVNAGTAVTIDALCMQRNNQQIGEFLGGMILPGISLMQSSLGQNTAQLPKHEQAFSLDAEIALNTFATSTADAINAGILSAITGAIAQMAQALETKTGQNPYIIFSGGDAPVIQRCLINAVKNPSIIIDHLVLKGLYLIERTKL